MTIKAGKRNYFGWILVISLLVAVFFSKTTSWWDFTGRKITRMYTNIIRNHLPAQLKIESRYSPVENDGVTIRLNMYLSTSETRPMDFTKLHDELYRNTLPLACATPEFTRLLENKTAIEVNLNDINDNIITKIRYLSNACNPDPKKLARAETFTHMEARNKAVLAEGPQALTKLRKAADQGDAEAQFLLGRMYANARGDKQDYTEAISWYRKAADQGYAFAQRNMGVMYEKGQGMPQNYKEAITWYRKAADKGDLYSLYSLGLMHEKGLGVPKDEKEAASWYYRAADQGYSAAQHNLGFLYDKGRGIKQNFKEAYYWYLKAAEQGHACAQNDVGVLFEKGYYVWQNSKEAAAWYRKSADQGFTLAQHNLAYMYEKGNGVSQDNKEAFSLYVKAAEKGNACAHNDLGKMYENGVVVAKNLIVAYALFTNSVAKGYNNAKSNVERLGKTLTPDQLQVAQKLSQDIIKAKSLQPIEEYLKK